MAKIGYIMAAAHYDKLEEDRQWMQEYGCVKIVVENDADENSRQLWKQLMIALERGDELVISKGSVMMPTPMSYQSLRQDSIAATIAMQRMQSGKSFMILDGQTLSTWAIFPCLATLKC